MTIAAALMRTGKVFRRVRSRARRLISNWYHAIARPVGRKTQAVARTIGPAAAPMQRSSRRGWKRTLRAIELTWVQVRRTGRRLRIHAWRYVFHYPPRWIKRYGWRTLVYNVYQLYGKVVLTTMRTVDAVMIRMKILGELRRRGPVVLSRLLRVPMPRLAESVGHPPLYREAHGIYLKERGRPYERSFQGPWGRLRYQQALEVGKQKKLLMWEAYTQVSKPVMLNVPYVYVALHFQPERTTSSLGGGFADQYLLVDMVARCVPPGWKVYVKEHPSQFYPPFCGERSRHKDFYADLLRLPNVELVSLGTSSFQLIDCARAVATVTGTVGWEAIVRGVPALVFGAPWYRGCDGVWLVPTENALREALTWVEAGVRPDYRKVRLFVRALEMNCARAGLGYGTPDEAELGLSHEEAVERLSSLLNRCWDRMRRTPPSTSARASLDRGPAARGIELDS